MKRLPPGFAQGTRNHAESSWLSGPDTPWSFGVRWFFECADSQLRAVDETESVLDCSNRKRNSVRWEGRHHREGGRERGELLWLKKESAGDQVTRRGVERE